jgi:hypothetical protein
VPLSGRYPHHPPAPKGIQLMEYTYLPIGYCWVCGEERAKVYCTGQVWACVACLFDLALCLHAGGVGFMTRNRDRPISLTTARPDANLQGRNCSELLCDCEAQPCRHQIHITGMWSVDPVIYCEKNLYRCLVECLLQDRRLPT